MMKIYHVFDNVNKKLNQFKIPIVLNESFAIDAISIQKILELTFFS